MIAMTNQIFKLAGVVFTCAVVAACSADVENPPPLNSGEASAGDADFTQFVSIGDSLTAGYADGALYLLGQQNSFPAMLAQQFLQVGGGAFVQPVLKNDLEAGIDGNLGALLVGGISGEIESRYVLNTETQSPERLEGTPTDDVIGTGLNGMAFNNMGVPGAKSFHLFAPGYGNPANLNSGAANPYYVRFAVDTTGAGLWINDVIAQAPSFYTLWLGNNDVLAYATSGGTGVDQTGSGNPVTAYGPDDITDPGQFNSLMVTTLTALEATNPAVQGVLINIPDVSTIPFFTTVPYNAVPLDQATADQLNAAYAAYNAGLEAAVAGSVITEEEAAQRLISFAEGQNAVVILDEDLTPIGAPNMRQATASDLVLLPVSSKIGTEATPGDPTTVWGLGMPLEDADVLIPSEIQAIDTARTAYNDAIKTLADASENRLYLDAAALMTELSESGINYGNGSITADFATGGGFSLDGVHPTARGYAVIANAVVDTINSGFNANVYKVDPATYPTVFLK
jgi:lysophospholipase L1-like esterase